MRILFYTVLALAFFSCEQPGIESPALYTGVQAKLNSIIDSFNSKILNAGNLEQKTILNDSCLHILASFFKDSIPGSIMKDFSVNIDNVQTLQLNGKYDLIVQATDKHFKYWMEIDYGSQKEELADSVYKTVVKLREGNQKINMLYLGELKKSTTIDHQYEVRVIFKP